VRAKDEVRRGQVIGKVGKTGGVDQPQLHFELRQPSGPVDPVPHLGN
jgi:murein DD-endopeptidase MepM/ murein hydrolase activator NlpD